MKKIFLAFHSLPQTEKASLRVQGNLLTTASVKWVKLLLHLKLGPFEHKQDVQAIKKLDIKKIVVESGVIFFSKHQ